MLALAAEEQATDDNIADARLIANAISEESRYYTGMEELHNRSEALLRIAVAQARRERWIASVLTAAGIHDAQYQSLALSQIAYMIAEAGDLTTAEEIATSLPALEQRACALKDIALLRAEQGAWDFAVATAGRITGEGRCGFHVGTSESPDAVTAEIAFLKAKRGDIGGARTLLAQVQQERIRYLTTTRIAVLQAQSGDVEGARSTLGTVPSTFRDPGWSAVAIAQAQRLQFDEALQSIQQIDNADTAFQMKEKLAMREAASGRDEQAMALVVDQADASRAAGLLLSIACGQHTAGHTPQALRTLTRIPDWQHRKSTIHRALFTMASMTATTQSPFQKPAWVDEQLSTEDQPYAYMGLAHGLLQKQSGDSVYTRYASQDMCRQE